MHTYESIRAELSRVEAARLAAEIREDFPRRTAAEVAASPVTREDFLGGVGPDPHPRPF